MQFVTHYAFFLLGLLPIVVVRAALFNTVVKTSYGSIQGYPAFNSSLVGMNLTNWKDITVWKGIPFAASTAGQNRFKAPLAPEPWNSTLLAAQFGAICPSSKGDTTGYTVSEDCLNLNVWSVANSTDAKLPVVMWSYPAGGSNADAMFDGAGMADKGVVFVNYNYRTGSFGWLAHPWLSTEFQVQTGHNSSGNWGLLDQFAALKWIRENIMAFGGDPNRITVMGQSAGSAATYRIVNSPLTKGLIVGAIIESGVRDPRDPLATSLAQGYSTLDAALSVGQKYVASLNISTIEQLRALPMNNLVTAFMSSWSFKATLDYYAMPDTYCQILLKGPANDVPILTGNTRDESGATYGLNISFSQYLLNLSSTYSGGNWSSQFLALYPANDSTTASAAQNAQFTDRSNVGTWLWSKLWSVGATSPVYNYYWDHAPPGSGRGGGAYHMSEIYYVLNNLYANNIPWAQQDYTIATIMNAYWVNFIKTGNPNGASLAAWAKMTSDNASVQRVGDGWGSIPVASPPLKVALFESWFESLQTCSAGTLTSFASKSFVTVSIRTMLAFKVISEITRAI